MKNIQVRGATENNLKNVSVDLPRNTLIVITGVSGSGKSSLAFDTIFKEGHRRFLESLSAYARRFLGGIDKPEVNSIEGLSPAISIEQRTIQRNPRSTVGTMTEIYDHLRLLYARLGVPHCPGCSKVIDTQGPEQVARQILASYPGRQGLFCAPVVRQRRGAFNTLCEKLKKDGFRRLLVDGELTRLEDKGLGLDPKKTHCIDVVYDRLEIDKSRLSRMVEAVERCFILGDSNFRLLSTEQEKGQEAIDRMFSGRFACADCQVDLPALDTRIFSFNLPAGMCPACKGTGFASQVDARLLIANEKLPLLHGGLAIYPAGQKVKHQGPDPEAFRSFCGQLSVDPEATWEELPPGMQRTLLRGRQGLPGLIDQLEEIRTNTEGALDDLVSEGTCNRCEGQRLSDLPRFVEFAGKRIGELCSMTVDEANRFLGELPLEGAARLIGGPLIEEITRRLGFLIEVGLGYLTIGRSAPGLAGGEIQRVRLAGQLGSGLQGVVFILDEPSVGLHPRDNRKLLDALCKLRDRGNTVIVVEHDQETMELADHIVDLGPGAGNDGGEVIAEGAFEDITAAQESLTGDYLAGRKTARQDRPARGPSSGELQISGIFHNNLNDVTVDIPLGLLVAVTGVSGSGKSSLINQVLRPALLRKLGTKAAPRGTYQSLSGYEFIDKVISVDQSPIGKSTRSNPATYSKAFALIRDLFARTPAARARGYKASRFSFNVDGGRCIECTGAGILSVDMQFLAPVEVVCEACGGNRYNRETLEIRYRGKNIAEVLDLTIKEALHLFEPVPRLARILETLGRLGLGYLKLGQPATTLSGGEGQRLKLANELQKTNTGQTLYLLDEPTTGLHFDDVRVLLEALAELVARGNSVVVIEHNLDVIGSADHIIDLGPEGGAGGGRIIAAGTPEELCASSSSHTGKALNKLRAGPENGEASSASSAKKETPPVQPGCIRVEGASLNNLKGVDVEIPHGKLTVLTGVSGSGKSTLAFGTLFAEGQRRYLDSLSTYARRFLGTFNSPPVEKITGLAPAIAINQKSTSTGSRSTVATLTEIHDYLRLLYAHIGEPHCPDCEQLLRWTTPSALADELVQNSPGEKLYILAPLCLPSSEQEDLRKILNQLLKGGCTRVLAAEEEIRLDEGEDAALRRVLNHLSSTEPEEAIWLNPVVDRVVVSGNSQSRIATAIEDSFSRTGGATALKFPGGELQRHYRHPSCPAGHFTFAGGLTPRMFSFNSFEGACPSCKGIGSEPRVDVNELISHPSMPLGKSISFELQGYLGKFRTSSLLVLKAIERHLDLGENYAVSELPREDLQILLEGAGEEKITLSLKMGYHETDWPGLVPLLEQWARDKDPNLSGTGIDNIFDTRRCSSCDGHRLRPESLGVRVGDQKLHQILSLTILEAREFFRDLKLDSQKAIIANDVLRELSNRLRFLIDTGLGYLSLNRQGNTLSGGEAQRIRLASQLGNRLTGAVYILDEPTIGLHESDTSGLLRCLNGLKEAGNTVIVVEHDRKMIEAADHMIDLGPGAGEDGGLIASQGSPGEVRADPASLTGAYLRGEKKVSCPRDLRLPSGDKIQLRGVNLHNLCALDVSFPCGLLTAVSGVSGSGKSTLVMNILSEAIRGHLRKETNLEHAAEITGLDSFNRLVTVDQKPIGRSPRSTPATYAGAWSLVRSLYARMPLAMSRGYKMGRFSFNSSEGQCPDCEGQGLRQVEMQFLSDIWVTCEECKGKRFNKSTLEVIFKGKNIADVLQMDVDEACGFFTNQPMILKFLSAMNDVGLGYLKLGQSSPTLSTGEAQRVKLAAELAGDRIAGTIYILDEPTTGLHFSETEKLLEILNRLVDGGGTVILIEHNMELVMAADWVVDMGPGAGPEGGDIVYQGQPSGLADCRESRTGASLHPCGPSSQSET